MSTPHETHEQTNAGHDHGPNHEGGHEGEMHIVPPRIYLIVGAILLFLTGVTVWASFLELNVWNPVIALFIACVKATIVVLFFMHVKYSSKLTKLTVGAGLFTFLTLIAMTLADYFTRAWGRW
jgi:cytochrome c oxidase subunit 4